MTMTTDIMAGSIKKMVSKYDTLLGLDNPKESFGIIFTKFNKETLKQFFKVKKKESMLARDKSYIKERLKGS